MTEQWSLQEAQATLIGCVIEHPDQAGIVFATVGIEDFDNPFQLVAVAIHSMRIHQKPITLLTVIDEMTHRGTIGQAGGVAGLHRIAGMGFGDIDYSLPIVARAARLRRLETAAIRQRQASGMADADPAAIARSMVETGQNILDTLEAEGDINTRTLGEFLDVEDRAEDWVIPGLLERMDRLILTGSEGLGKSTLFRQIGVCAAAGIHPFTHEKIAPQRVFFVDCENSETQMRRALRPLTSQAKRLGHDPSSNVFIESRPEGIDLTKPEDEMWLVKRVAALQPALLLTGSLYKLHTKNPNDEEPARALARVLDRCRSVANCAIVVEGHSGHGYGNTNDGKRPVRPVGSSLWLRWPEFGYGLRATDDYDPNERLVDFVGWRGDRSERDWPTQLQSGGLWPWTRVVSHDTYVKPHQRWAS